MSETVGDRAISMEPKMSSLSKSKREQPCGIVSGTSKRRGRTRECPLKRPGMELARVLQSDSFGREKPIGRMDIRVAPRASQSDQYCEEEPKGFVCKRRRPVAFISKLAPSSKTKVNTKKRIGPQLKRVARSSSMGVQLYLALVLLVLATCASYRQRQQQQQQQQHSSSPTTATTLGAGSSLFAPVECLQNGRRQAASHLVFTPASSSPFGSQQQAFAVLSDASVGPAQQAPSVSLHQNTGTEIHLVRGLASVANSSLELPCLVDQANCGEVYYITWTKQAAPNGLGSQQTAWTRVYLYTGVNDSAPHKPIGDLVNRATFVMPERSVSGLSESNALAPGSSRAPPLQTLTTVDSTPKPMARLVIDEPRLGDEALYKCDVTYVRGKCPSISMVRVQMMALPDPARIYQIGPGTGRRQLPPPMARTQLLGPMNEHDQLRLSCLVTGGRPAPKSVFWRKIDAGGRTINLTPTTTAGQRHQSSLNGANNGMSQAATDQFNAATSSAAIEVALNHTLTSGDLGAKFECHVEHEALDILRPTARIIATANEAGETRGQSSSGTTNGRQMVTDSMLDLHPGLTPTGDELDGDTSSAVPSSASSDNARQSISLDSHVMIDLNVGVASLDLFLTRMGGQQDAGIHENGNYATGKRNASEPLVEGDLIELECIAYNSKPAANITWLNGSELIGADELEASTTTMSTINTAHTAYQHRQHYNPFPATIQSRQQQQRSQRNRRLLQRNQVQLNSDGHTYNTHSFLSIKLSRHEHRAQISCQAQNGPMKQPIVKSIELQVQHAPIVLMEPASGIVTNEYEPKSGGGSVAAVQQLAQNVHLSSTQTPPQTGEQVQIYCIYSANPSMLVPNSVRWFKDGQPLAVHGRPAPVSPAGGHSSDELTNQLSTSTGDRLIESITPTGYPVLKIKQVSRHDAGRYDCQLANSVGSSERLLSSESCKLEVNFRPSVQLHLQRLKPTDGVGGGGEPEDSGSGGEQQSLQEVDLDRDLILAGAELVLFCNVLEAQPNKITKYHWFSVTTSGPQQQQQQQQTTTAAPLDESTSRGFGPGPLAASPRTVSSSQSYPTALASNERQTRNVSPGSSSSTQAAPSNWRPLAVTEGDTFKLSPLQVNFSATSFACSATNSIGPSDLSNPIDLRLSYTPGPSFVRPVTDLMQRKIIVASGKPAHLSPSATDHSPSPASVPTNSWASGRQVRSGVNEAAFYSPMGSSNEMDSQPIPAGKELLLECVTQDLGQPRANIWLWFKDGQTIESLPLEQEHQHEQTPAAAVANNNGIDGQKPAVPPAPSPDTSDDSILKRDNPMSDRLRDWADSNSNNINSSAAQDELKTLNTRSAATNLATSTDEQQRRQQNQQQQQQQQFSFRPTQTKARLLASGRYFFIPSIQLAHKGNYSCVALNRLGPGNGLVTSSASSVQETTLQKQQRQQQQQQIGQFTQSSGRSDSYQLRVALAPSFVHPLALRTYWPEVQMVSGANDVATAATNLTNSSNHTLPLTQQLQQRQLHQQQQLELTCHVQCEPICHIEWLRNNEFLDLKRQSENIVSYHVRHTVMAENVELNMFKSIESKLVLQFQSLPASASSSNGADQSAADKRLLIDRDKLLERRHYLNNSNFTCQSSSNSMGPSVRSTTQFVVQYPPENVIINAPSDKLNLVEGSNGPYLSCEASGEPQVQYRWLLLKSGNNVITSSDLVAARYNMKHYGNLSLSQLWSKRQQEGKQQQQQLTSDAPMHLSISNSAMGPGGTGQNPGLANDVGLEADSPATTNSANASAQRFVDLTELSHGEQVGGASISTLDLSRSGIDRKRSGHYICEASNKFGQTRRSVYVNVLYKPTCTTLHMHSLDLTVLDQNHNNYNHNHPESLLRKDPSRQQPSRGGGSAQDATVMGKPFRANGSDEYSIIKEASGDFINLRRVLVMSPLFNRYTPELNNAAGELSLKESIFGPILSSGGEQQLISSHGGSMAGERGSLLNDASYDQNRDENSLSSPVNMAAHPGFSTADTTDSGSSSKPTDSWSRFNSALLKFLNGYITQIKTDESHRAIAYEQLMSRQPTRRSSSSTLRAKNTEPLPSSPAAPTSFASLASDNNRSTKITKSLLTFACMVQEGNPMNNLTFDWYFGSMKLPNEQQTIMDTHHVSDRSSDSRGGSFIDQTAPRGGDKPFLIYSNENSSLAIILTRRLDTETILNPFQISFLTINVISLSDRNHHHADDSNNLGLDFGSTTATASKRRLAANEAAMQEANNDDGNSAGGNNNDNKTMFMRAPVIKSRYQSFYNSLKANSEPGNQQQQQQHQGQELRDQDNTIQFSQEFIDSRLPHASNYIDINLNAHNWHEKLGQLLKCSVSNSIGTSEASYVRVNLAERLKSNSLYEFSNWRMQSLASKSILIISILLSCAVFVFVTFVQIIVPRLRTLEMNLQKRPDSGSSRDDTGTNTGQSTSSQKSSVLGLIGHGGDSSFHGSSDDDTSARLNQLDSGISAISNNIQHLRSTLSEHNTQHHHSNNIGNNLDLYNSMTSNDRLVDGNGTGANNMALGLADTSGGDSINYDQPRGANQVAKMIYQSEEGQFNVALEERHKQIGADYENYHYHQGHLTCTGNENSSSHREQVAINNNELQTKSSLGSASSKILASLRLKPFSKFKVDRISDISNRMSLGGGLHDRNVSNSETATTGISSSDPSENSDSASNAPPAARRPLSSHNFGMPSVRHSYSGLRRQLAPRPMSSAYYAHRGDGEDLQNLSGPPTNGTLEMHLSSQQHQHQLRHQVSANTNHSYTPVPNAMDEFMRRRGLDPSLASSSFDAANYDDSTLAIAYGSHSIRKQSSTMFSLKDDLLASRLPQPKTTSRMRPPVYPRSTADQQRPFSQYQASTMAYSKPAPPAPPPPIAVRANQRQMFQNQPPQSYGKIYLNDSIGAAPYPANYSMQQQHLASSRIDTIDTHLNRLVDSVALGGFYTNNNNEGQQQHQIAYANAFQFQHDPYNAVPSHDYQANHSQQQQNHQRLVTAMQNIGSPEHIYDLNAYATPEQTPIRQTISSQARQEAQSRLESERPAPPRVSQLIQTFNTKLPPDQISE